MNVTLEDIFVVFNYNEPSETTALRGLNLKINSGDRITVVGNNRNGKSTLLRLIAGHVETTFGKVIVDGKDVTHEPPAERAEIFSLISCDHDDNCHDDLPVLENLILAIMGRQDTGIFKPAITEQRLNIITEYLEKYDFLDLKELLYTHTKCIPQAQKYALALLMSALKRPKVLLVDDFMSNINQKSGRRLIETIKRVVQDQNMMLMAVMSTPKMEFEFFNRCIILGNGKVALDLTGEAKTKLDFSKIFDHFDVTPNIKEIEKDGVISANN